MKLYTYWRSTSSYRVRIALALKGLDADHHYVHLVHGEQSLCDYRAINPQSRVPALVLDDGTVLTQSPAIIEYLEEAYPEPRLLPQDLGGRAKTRAIAAIIGCDIHPLHNISVLKQLRQSFNGTEQDVSQWIQTWISQGFSAIEALIGEHDYSLGSEPSVADVYLIPQIYAAERFGVPMGNFPKIARVAASAAGHYAFQKAHPANQRDRF